MNRNEENGIPDDPKIKVDNRFNLDKIKVSYGVIVRTSRAVSFLHNKLNVCELRTLR